jgi:tetratricopeptide (TPR) repeat protein
MRFDVEEEDDGLIRGETELEYQSRVRYDRDAAASSQPQQPHNSRNRVRGRKTRHGSTWARTSASFQVDKTIIEGETASSHRTAANIGGVNAEDLNESEVNSSNVVPYLFKPRNPILKELEEMHGILKHPLNTLTGSDMISLKENLTNRFSEIFEEGKEAFERGDIDIAIHKFEAALQLSNKMNELNSEYKQRTLPTTDTTSSVNLVEGAEMDASAEMDDIPSCSEVWRMLGQCHAEHDEDRTAIDCLERAIAEDP